MKQWIEPGTEHLIPYAKKLLRQCAAARADLRLPAMNKTQVIDGVTVQVWSADFGETIRLTGGDKYFVNIPMTTSNTPYRDLFLDTLDSQTGAFSGTGYSAPTSTLTYEQVGSIAQGLSIYTITDWRGVLFRDTGTLTAAGDTNADSSQTFSNYYGGGGIINGSAGNAGGIPFNNIVISAVTVLPSDYTAASLAMWTGIHAAEILAYSNSAGARLDAVMSDQEILLSIPRTTADGSSFVPIWDGPWLGEEGSLTYPNGFVAFSVPPDTRSVQTGATAVAREKARLLTSSQNVIAALQAGVMPVLGGHAWTTVVKANAPDSTKPRTEYPLTGTLLTAEVPLTGLLGTGATEYDETVTRSVELSYTDADGETHTEIVTGTWRQQSVSNTLAFYLINTYENFPLFDPTTGISVFVAPAISASMFGTTDVASPAADSSNLPLGSIANGVRTATGYYADSTWGTPTDPFYYSTIEQPPEASEVTYTTAPLFLEYLRTIKHPRVEAFALRDPPETAPAYNTNWLSTSMVAGEVVSLTLYGPLKDAAELGIYGTHTGADTDAFIIYGTATFKYEATGELAFVAWQDAQPEVKARAASNGRPARSAVPAGPKVVPLEDSVGVVTLAAQNCLIKYTKFQYADTKLLATTQKNVLAGEPTAATPMASRFIRLVQKACGL